MHPNKVRVKFDMIVWLQNATIKQLKAAADAAVAVAAAAVPDDGHVPGFAEAVVIGVAESAPSPTNAAIIVDLPRGRRVTIFSAATPALATSVLKALR